MGALLAYALVSGLLLLAMYLIYRLFLAAENQHGYNRGVLLSIYLVAFAALPIASLFAPGDLTDAAEMQACEVAEGEVLAAPESPIEVAVSVTDEVPYVEAAEPTLTRLASRVDHAVEEAPLWGRILLWVYLSGTVIVALRTLHTWLRILRVVASGERTRRDGYTLVVTDNPLIAPFSWLNYMVINRADYANCGATIMAHELRHIRCHHGLDLLLAQAVVLVNWFNPAAWLMREELMLIHEYQADMAVIDAGFDPQAYQMLLIKKAVGARFPSLANSLNHSKLKKRITMMYQEKSSKMRRLKALALVPAIALALVVAGMPSVDAAIDTIRGCSVTTDKGKEISDNLQIAPAEPIEPQAESPVATEAADHVAVMAAELAEPVTSADLAPIAEISAKPAIAIEIPATEPEADELSEVTKAASEALDTMSEEAVTTTAADAVATPGRAHYRLQELSNAQRKTTLGIVATQGAPLKNVTDATFTTCGKTYRAKSVACVNEQGREMIVATFPFVKKFSKVSVTVTVDGTVVPVKVAHTFADGSTTIDGYAKISDVPHLFGASRDTSMQAARKGLEVARRNLETARHNLETARRQMRGQHVNTLNSDDINIITRDGASPACKRVTKEFYGTKFTGDWVNPCKGATTELLATIRLVFVPDEGGYKVIGKMYDKDNVCVKVGKMYYHGEPDDFRRVNLNAMQTVVRYDKR